MARLVPARDPARAQFGVAAGVLAVCILLTVGCGRHVSPANGTTPVAQAAAEELQADVATVQEVSWPAIVRSQGSLAVDERSVLGAKVAGRVAAVYFDLGDAVSAGDLLVALDEREFELRVAQAKAQLQEARAAIGLAPEASDEQLDPRASPPVREAKAVLEEALLRKERVQRLLDEQAASEEAFQQADAQVKVAESRYASALNGANEKIAQIRTRSAELAVAQQELQDARTTAPFSGYVQMRHAAPGAFVQVGNPLFTLVRTDMLRFRGTIPERHAQQLALGQQVTLYIEGVAEPRVVQVTRISPSIDERSRSLLFEAMIDNRDKSLHAGLFAQAEVVLDAEATALVVPATAVTEFAGTEKVWTVVDGAAREQAVQTGQRRGEQIEILDGLAPGDRLLVHAALGREAPIRETPTRKPDAIAAPGTAPASAPSEENSSSETKPGRTRQDEASTTSGG